MKKNFINLFTSSICILKNKLYRVLMHEKKNDKAKETPASCVLKYSKSTVCN